MLDMIAEGSNAETAARTGRTDAEDHLTIRGDVADFDRSVRKGGGSEAEIKLEFQAELCHA